MNPTKNLIEPKHYMNPTKNRGVNSGAPEVVAML